MKKKKIDAPVPMGILGEGRVIKNTGSAYVVRMSGSGEELNCRIKGNFRIKGIRTTNPVAVGDIVTVSEAADDADYITAIAPARTISSGVLQIYRKRATYWHRTSTSPCL